MRTPLAGRSRQALGDALELVNFGVNPTELAPGVWSAQRHWHRRQGEFTYVPEAEVVFAVAVPTLLSSTLALRMRQTRLATHRGVYPAGRPRRPLFVSDRPGAA